MVSEFATNSENTGTIDPCLADDVPSGSGARSSVEALASSGRSRWGWVFVLGLAPLHIVGVSSTVGLRPEHVVLDLVLAVLFFVHPRTARFAALALPFWLVGALYEAMPLVLPLRGEIHVGDLHTMELALFGIGFGDEILIPSAWLGQHLHPVLDLLCGLAYLLYLFETFGAALYLYLKRSSRAALLAWGFLLLNIAGMVTYVLYPAAPPWYVELHGLGPAVLDAAPSAARTARFDELVGVPVFASFYSRNVNVFGAMPSLHCAYPTLVFFIMRPLGRWFAAGAGAFALWVAFSALYLNHHYLLDALAGILYGTIVYGVVLGAERMLSHRRRQSRGENDCELDCVRLP